MANKNTKKLREPAETLYGVRSKEKESSKPAFDQEKFLQTIKQLPGFQNVRFIIFHGSTAEGRALPDSDIDICIYYEGTEKERWDYRLNLLKELPDAYDVQIFQELPLVVRQEVLKGRTLYVKDPSILRRIAQETRDTYRELRPQIIKRLKEETGNVRIDLIHSKLCETEDAVREIEENLPETYEEFQKIRIIKSGIYKETEHAIENIIDVCAVLNADQSLGKPSDVDDILTNLVNAGTLHKETGEKIREMKRFRNILVHKYGKVNDETAYSDVKEGLTDIRSIVKEIRDKFGIGNGEEEG